MKKPNAELGTEDMMKDLTGKEIVSSLDSLATKDAVQVSMAAAQIIHDWLRHLNMSIGEQLLALKMAKQLFSTRFTSRITISNMLNPNGVPNQSQSKPHSEQLQA